MTLMPYRAPILCVLLFFATMLSALSQDWTQRWRDYLDRDLLPYWLHENEAASRPDDPRSRFFTPQLRRLYVLAVGIARTNDATARRELRARFSRQYDSLIERFHDAGNGGWHGLAREMRAAAEESGTSAKSTTDQAWAIYLLAEIHALTGDPAPLQLAQRTFAQMDPRAHDSRQGGYFWDGFTGGASAERDSKEGRKYSSLQLHMLLALARLKKFCPDDSLAAQRFEEIRRLFPRFVCLRTGHARWMLGRDWTQVPSPIPADNQTLYGQNAEIITYLLDVSNIQGPRADGQFPFLETIAAGLIRDGITPAGAVCFRGPMDGAASDRRAWWWPQIETVTAMRLLYENTGQPVYQSTFEKVSAWTFAHMISPQTPARWHTICDSDGQPLPHGNDSHEIQTGFHVIRSILCMEKWMVPQSMNPKNSVKG